jgi:hypothetical protein
MRARHALVSVLSGRRRLAGAAAPQANPFLGKWNMTGTGTDAANVYWLEIQGRSRDALGNVPQSSRQPESARAREGRETASWCSTKPAAAARSARSIAPSSRTASSSAHHTITVGGRPGSRPGRASRSERAAPAPAPAANQRADVNWVGVRPPAWPANLNANAAHQYDKPVVLFDGTSMDAFGVQNPNRELGWTLATAR